MTRLASPHGLAERRWGAPDGRSVVLLHGLVVSSAYLAPTARMLGGDLDVRAPDLPRYGGSAGLRAEVSVPALAEALVQWMEDSGISGTTLVGTSFGCQIAVEAAVRKTDLVGALVLSSPTMDPRLRSLPALLPRWFVEQSTQSMPLRLQMLRDYRRAGMRTAAATVRAAMSDHVEEKLPRCPQPALVVGGTRDPIARPAWCREVADLLPQGRVEILDGAAHAMCHEDPRRLAVAIRRFLGVEPSG